MPQALNGKLSESLMEPGVYQDFNEDNYHADPALGSTDIKNGYEGKLFNLAKFYGRKTGQIPVSKSSGYAVGSVIHYLVLECNEGMIEEEIKKVAVKKPKGMQYRSNENKKWRDDHEAAGLAILTEFEWNAAIQATSNILQNRLARWLLRGSKNEVSVWDREFETGLHLKARFDIVAADGLSVGDLKSTADNAGPGSGKCFGGTFMKYQYYRQAGHYKIVSKPHGIRAENYFMIVFEKEPPYQVAVHRIDNATLDFAMRSNMEALRKIQKANEIGIWPGYSQEYYPIGVPEQWIAASHNDEFWEEVQ